MWFTRMWCAKKNFLKKIKIIINKHNYISIYFLIGHNYTFPHYFKNFLNSINSTWTFLYDKKTMVTMISLLTE
jgi:hypothetical protein